MYEGLPGPYDIVAQSEIFISIQPSNLLLENFIQVVREPWLQEVKVQPWKVMSISSWMYCTYIQFSAFNSYNS
jgi:hypothetical protein